jgi:hypothetical protein
VRENNNGAITSTKLYNDIPVTTQSDMEFSLSSESVDSEITIQDSESTRVITSVSAQGIEDGDVVMTRSVENPDPPVASSTEEVVAEPEVPAPRVNVATGGGGSGGTYYYAPPTPSGEVLGVSTGFEDTAKMKREDILKQIVAILQQIISLVRQQLQIKNNIVY